MVPTKSAAAHDQDPKNSKHQNIYLNI